MDEGGLSSRKRSFPEDSSSTQQKRVKFPEVKKKAKTGGDYVLDVECGAGWRDPRIAATQRRTIARNQLTAELFEEFEGGGEMFGEETFVDDGVQNMEPFNLEKEREEGYFDVEGNYVEFINEDLKDSWLDSIDASKIALGNYVKPKNQDDDDASDLSSGTAAEIKRRIADVLESGETVLQALRRLKGTSNNRKKEKMSVETKKTFDQLTQDAMLLLENGDYNVYDEKQEAFHRQAEGYEKQAFVLDNLSEDAFDMFADEDGSVSNTANQTSDGGYLQNDYVYEETFGYYYSRSLGYYYDPSTGLYCYAETGQWYSYNEESGVYEECQQAAVTVSS